MLRFAAAAEIVESDLWTSKFPHIERFTPVSPMPDQPKREYRVVEQQQGYVVQSRDVGLDRWTDGPIFLSEEKAEEAMRRLAGPTRDVDSDDRSF